MEIDGVFSGGGIKGISLVGAYRAIEKKGFRFKRVAGTSAGSILAAFIAAKYTSDEIYEIIDEMNFEEFLDERRTMIPSPVAKWFLLYWRLGLYKGEKLERWLETKLRQKGIQTFSDLPPKTLRVIASDLTNGRLIVLPDDLHLYGINPKSFSVAKAIRMSCSIPYFFEPVKLYDKHNQCVVVDGGVLSNFPMWLFDKKESGKLKRPVLGIQLSHKASERPVKKICNGIELFGALFETMKEAHDARYISKKHEKNIIFIPTEGILATEFHLTPEKKSKLFKEGEERAEQFLATWAYS